eukprot:scaffold1122_cov377-Prasinococcus_capsulatus_cf.AAC.6
MVVNLEDLCVCAGKSCWVAYVDICCLDANGGLFDAALLALVAALGNTSIPVSCEGVDAMTSW